MKKYLISFAWQRGHTNIYTTTEKLTEVTIREATQFVKEDLIARGYPDAQPVALAATLLDEVAE